MSPEETNPTPRAYGATAEVLDALEALGCVYVRHESATGHWLFLPELGVEICIFQAGHEVAAFPLDGETAVARMTVPTVEGERAVYLEYFTEQLLAAVEYFEASGSTRLISFRDCPHWLCFAPETSLSEPVDFFFCLLTPPGQPYGTRRARVNPEAFTKKTRNSLVYLNRAVDALLEKEGPDAPLFFISGPN